MHRRRAAAVPPLAQGSGYAHVSLVLQQLHATSEPRTAIAGRGSRPGRLRAPGAPAAGEVAVCATANERSGCVGEAARGVGSAVAPPLGGSQDLARRWGKRH
jgi:hypothetical protein